MRKTGKARKSQVGPERVDKTTNTQVPPEAPVLPRTSPAESEHFEEPDRELLGATMPVAEASEIAPLSSSKHHFWHTKKAKPLLLTGGIILLLAILFAVPITRYGILGTFIKKDVTIHTTDVQTGKPISDIELALDGKTVKTDASGMATFRQISAGPHNLNATKKYYDTTRQSVDVPLFGAPSQIALGMKAIGRQITVKVTNKLNGQPLNKVNIAAADTIATTDEKGVAEMVLPADKATVDGTLKAQGYNQGNVTIKISDASNEFSMVPAGKLYFLSKRTGKIDVMRSDIDGSNVQTVIAGTGREEESNTVLLASRDWRNLALLSRRDSPKPKLYHIDTGSEKMSVIDEGADYFTLVGWHNDSFIYEINRNTPVSQPKSEALKSYNVTSNALTTLDENKAESTSAIDYARETIGNVYIIESGLVYTKEWSAYYLSPHRADGQKTTINFVKPDGSGRKVLKDFDATNGVSISAKLYKPQEVYFRVQTNTKSSDVKTAYYEYEADRVVLASGIDDDKFYGFYPTYLLSPAGKSTFWYEPRDGKNSLFAGDAKAGNPKEVAALSEYKTYGWYSDEYLLLSKKGSELYILPHDNRANLDPRKITDYHKPSAEFYGYGYGYGGF